jgi:acyl-CoA dehydrogenase
MGFTQEHPLHFATRRLWSWREEFGHEAFWQQRIGMLVCAAGGDALWQRLVG